MNDVFSRKASPNTGKPSKDNGPYFIESVENYVKYLVKETEKNIMLDKRNTSLDSLYNKISLAKNDYMRRSIE